MISLRDVVTGFGNRDPLAEVWRRSLRGGGGGAAEITGVPPLRYIGNGRPLTDYLISGNAVQDGTPTPESPVPVVGCGTDTAGEWTLPLTVNGVEYPIYLGTAPTTRRVKKLVLTGEETWYSSSMFIGSMYVYHSQFPGIARRSPIYCSHLIAAGSISQYQHGTCLCDATSVNLWIFDTTTSPAAFKSYLAAQYANGTPVTVWYVLAEPETAIVNEPLMKIGDYADTISFAQAGVTIPTVNGANVLDVPTKIKPSEITIKGGISSV